MSPLILSIIIPVYNRQDSLEHLLSVLSKSIIDASFEQQVEVIVIDDSSSTAVHLSDFPFSVRLKRNQENRGAPYSRQRGFELSQARFIHFHDSDDLITENWLYEIIQQLSSQPKIDLFMTGRIDQDIDGESFRSQKYFHKQILYVNKVQSRLVYRNCLGPLGGVTFSRRVLEKITFKNFASCQDWQMYIDAIKHAEVLSSRPDIKFIFNKTGGDRISYHPRKKILGHLQLAKITAKNSVFKKNIRLFYLYTCKQHIYNKGGTILKFYKKNRLGIVLNFLIVSIYWRLF